MQSLEDIVKARQADFKQHKARKDEREKMSGLKTRSHKKAVFNELERGFGRSLTAAEKKDKAIRDGKSRRNTASALDPMERQARILCVLQYLNKTFKKAFCFPSQEKIQALLKRWYGLEVSNRTLNRDLNAMEARGHIKRKRRLSWTKFSSTLYTISKIGYVWWSALQKAFGLFKKNRLPNLANNNVLLRNKEAYKDESTASNLTQKQKGSPNGQILNSRRDALAV